MAKRRQAKTPDYAIGYGRPPRETQFKPGESGNPNGRPKRQLNVRAVVEDALRQTVEIREGGSLSMFEAVVTTVLDKARRGDAKVLSFILALLRLIGLTAETPESTRSEPVTANDLEIIASYLRRYGGASSENAPDHAVDDQQNGALNEGTKP